MFQIIKCPLGLTTLNIVVNKGKSTECQSGVEVFRRWQKSGDKANQITGQNTKENRGDKGKVARGLFFSDNCLALAIDKTSVKLYDVAKSNPSIGNDNLRDFGHLYPVSKS